MSMICVNDQRAICAKMNPLAPGRCGSNLNLVIFKRISRIDACPVKMPADTKATRPHCMMIAKWPRVSKAKSCILNKCWQLARMHILGLPHLHYDDVIMGVIAYQITSFAIVFSTVYLGTDQRKHQSSASLAIVRGIHRRPVNSPHKWPVTQKMFPFDDVIMWRTRFPPTWCWWPRLHFSDQKILIIFQFLGISFDFLFYTWLYFNIRMVQYLSATDHSLDMW